MIVDEIVSRKTRYLTTIGVYRLAMKSGSDNFRDAAVIDIMKQLRDRGFDIVVYEPTVSSYEDFKINNDLESFTTECDLVIANRISIEHRILFGKKLFTRDVFGTD